LLLRGGGGPDAALADFFGIVLDRIG